MEHFIRIAFWIVTLSGCLLANPVPRINSDDLRIDLIKKNVKCEPNSTFYAPKNVEDQCFTKALDCFIKELKGTVTTECGDNKGYIEATVEALENGLGNSFELNNSSICACENWPTLPLNNFLDALKHLLQENAVKNALVP